MRGLAAAPSFTPRPTTPTASISIISKPRQPRHLSLLLLLPVLLFLFVVSEAFVFLPPPSSRLSILPRQQQSPATLLGE
jgi:hypothetical protein